MELPDFHIPHAETSAAVVGARVSSRSHQQTRSLSNAFLSLVEVVKPLTSEPAGGMRSCD